MSLYTDTCAADAVTALARHGWNDVTRAAA